MVITADITEDVQELLQHARLAILDAEVLLCWRGSLPENVVVDTIDEEGNVLHTGFPRDVAARQEASDSVIKRQTMVQTGAAARALAPEVPRLPSPWDEERIALLVSWAKSPDLFSLAASSQQLAPTPRWESQHAAAPAASQPCFVGPPWWSDAEVKQRRAEIDHRAQMQEAEEHRRAMMSCEEWAEEIEICQQTGARIAVVREDLAAQARQVDLLELRFEMQGLEKDGAVKTGASDEGAAGKACEGGAKGNSLDVGGEGARERGGES